MAHTKGPWKLVFGNIVGADNKGIFHQSVMLKNVKTAGEMEANARLIASAPELLDALKDAFILVKALEHIEKEKGIWRDEITKSKIEQAIAKAEGKE